MGEKTGRRMLLIAGLFLTAALMGTPAVLVSQDAAALTADLNSRGIPAESIAAEDGAVRVRLNYALGADHGLEAMERTFTEVFSRVGIACPDGTAVTVIYCIEGRVVSEVTAGAENIAGMRGGSLTAEDMLARIDVQNKIDFERTLSGGPAPVGGQPGREAGTGTRRELPEKVDPEPAERDAPPGDEGSPDAVRTEVQRGGAASSVSIGGGGGVVAAGRNKAVPAELLVLGLFLLAALFAAVILLAARRGTEAPPLKIPAGLEIMRPGGGKADFRFSRPRTTVGRDTSNHLVIDDPGVSAFHAEIFISPGRVQIKDCGSMNGTVINRRKAAESSLFLGDMVQIGDTILKLVE